MTATGATTKMLDMLQRTKTEIIPGGISADAMKKLLESAQAEVDAFFAGFSGAKYSGGSKTRNIKPKKDKKEKEFSKTFDWIAIRIEKLKETAQKAIDSVSNYISYKNKNKQLELAIKAKVDEKSSLEDIKKSYENLAKNVGLSKEYRDLVDNGGLDVQTIKDEKLANKIDEYKQWSDAAKSVGEKIGDINKSIEELNSQKLDNIKSYFDTRNSFIDSKISKREGIISLKEAQGKTATKSDYDYLINQQKSITANKQKEYNSYKKEIQDMLALGSKNGGFDKASAEYYEVIAYLNEINIAANEARVAIIDLSHEKIKLDFTSFDKGIAKIDSTISGIDQAANLVDENSIEQITLFQTGYQQTAIKAKELNEEIAKLNKQFAKSKDDVLYKERLKDLESQLSNNASAMKSYEQSIISAMKARYDKQLDLDKDALDEELKNIEKLRKAKIDALNEELDKYKEIIDARKKALQDEAKNEDYQSKIAEYTKSINELESRIETLRQAELTGDRTAKKERLTAEEELAKKKEELDKLQKDKAREEALDALDKEYDEFEKNNKNKINETNKYWDSEKDRAQKEYDDKALLIKDLYENEKQLIIEAAQLTKEEFSKAFESINTTLSQYGLSVSPELSDIYATNNKRSKNVTALIGEAGSHNTVYGDNSKASDLNKYLASMGYKTFSNDEAGIVKLAQALGLTDITKESDVNNGSVGIANKNRILEALKKAGFKKGGMALTKGLINSIGEDAIGLIKNREIILNQTDSKTFQDFVPIMKDFTNQFKSYAPNVPNLTTNKSSYPDVNIYLPANSTISNDAINNYRKFIPEITNAVCDNIMKISKTK